MSLQKLIGIVLSPFTHMSEMSDKMKSSADSYCETISESTEEIQKAVERTKNEVASIQRSKLKERLS